MKVFLGGTCNESDWRSDLISMLEVDYFNPVVEDWTPDCMLEELKQRQICDYNLYVLTPKMTGVYSIAEVVDDSNKQPAKTLFCVLDEDDRQFFTEGQRRSLQATQKLVKSNGVKTFISLYSIAEFLNARK